MVKRSFDIVFSVLVLVVAGPAMVAAIAAVWLHDRGSPFYRAPRVGFRNADFEMLKIRSMRLHADRSGVSSTGASDDRITPVGRCIRRFKLDELSQFWNVLKGDMSVVGPRPNIRRGGVELYTTAEMKLLETKPGITDLSSVVFSDEGEILDGAADPDGLYDQIIRPWKSRLGLLYIARASLALDLHIIWLTVLAITSKDRALRHMQTLLHRLGADPELVEICGRRAPLPVGLPPGQDFEFLNQPLRDHTKA